MSTRSFRGPVRECRTISGFVTKRKNNPDHIALAIRREHSHHENEWCKLSIRTVIVTQEVLASTHVGDENEDTEPIAASDAGRRAAVELSHSSKQ